MLKSVNITQLDRAEDTQHHFALEKEYLSSQHALSLWKDFHAARPATTPFTSDQCLCSWNSENYKMGNSTDL